MDDNSFDKFVKDKLGHYEDPSFDSSALSDFHDRLAAFRPSPWYVKYRTEAFVAASLILFTIVNWYIIQGNVISQKKISTKAAEDFRDQTQLIDSLTVAIQNMKSQQKSTVYLIDPARQNEMAVVKRNSTVKRLDSPVEENTHGEYTLLLGSAEDISPDVYKILEDQGMITRNGDEIYLKVSRYKMSEQSSSPEMDNAVAAQFRPVIELQAPKVVKNDSKSMSSLHQKELSGKMRNDIEKHYFQGLGINIAPHLDVMGGAFSQGSGGLTPRVGVTAEWVVSPRLSIETGLDYANTKFSLTDDFSCLHAPDKDKPYGPMEKAEVITRTASIPVSFKYRQWISVKNQAIFKVGYTPYFAFQKQYEYNYGYRPNPYGDDMKITEIERKDENSFYGGTLTASAGITSTLKEKNKFETSLFYEKSLGTVGSEKLNMQLFGLRAAYWFKIK